MAKPDNLPEWDTTGVNAIEPDQTHKDEGWLAPGGVPEKPPFQTFNYWQNEVYRWLKEINDVGILGWTNDVDYTADVAYVVGSDGILYRAKINNGPSSTVVDPVGDLTGTWIVASLSISNTAQAQAGTDDSTAISPLKLREGLNAAGPAPVYACRAWVSFNGTGAVAINGSGNVSSITDNGTGDYTINFANNMQDENYSVNVNCRFSNYTSQIRTTLNNSVRVDTREAPSNASTDRDLVTVTVFR